MRSTATTLRPLALLDVFLRKSRYSAPGFQDIDQRNPQVRVFLPFNSAL
jgi:hypothetical protein